MVQEQATAHGAPDESSGVVPTPEPPRVLVFFDYACAFCYVDGFRVDRLAAEHGAVVLQVPFELRPGMAAEGISASAEGLGHSDNVDAYLLKTAEQEGFGMQVMDYIPNTHDALVMGELARDAGPEMHDRVHDAIFSAYFADGRDIGDRDILRDIALETGLDVGALGAAWESGTYEERLEGYGGVARMLEIAQIPAALICNELVIGMRPYQVLEDALSRCMVTREDAESAPPGAAAEPMGQAGSAH